MQYSYTHSAACIDMLSSDVTFSSILPSRNLNHCALNWKIMQTIHAITYLAYNKHLVQWTMNLLSFQFSLKVILYHYNKLSNVWRFIIKKCFFLRCFETLKKYFSTFKKMFKLNSGGYNFYSILPDHKWNSITKKEQTDRHGDKTHTHNKYI